jgi:hypothetical protein
MSFMKLARLGVQAVFIAWEDGHEAIFGNQLCARTADAPTA